MLTLFLTLIAGSVMFVYFVRLEERDQPERVLAIVLALLIVEPLLYPSQNSVPGGIFHPSLGSQPIRLPDVLIPAALVARLLVRGWPRRMGATATAWTLLIGWVFVELVVGQLANLPFNMGSFQARMIIYVGGGMALTAGVPARRLLKRSFLLQGALVVAGVFALWDFLTVTGRDFAIPAGPVLPGIRFGRLSGDAASLAVSVALVASIVEMARHRPSRWMVPAVVVLFASTLLSDQRAAIIGLLGSLAALAVVAVGRTWRDRINTTLTQGVLALLFLVAPLLVLLVAESATASEQVSTINLPFQSTISQTFFSEGKTQSAETRVLLWKDALDKFSSNPVLGTGLGTSYNTAKASGAGQLDVGGAHNIYLDLLSRSGIVGLALFLAAIVLSMRDAAHVWRRAHDRLVAALALGCATTLAGFLLKGAVESLFEKFRLAVMIGMLLGVISSTTGEMGARETEAVPAFEEAY